REPHFARFDERRGSGEVLVGDDALARVHELRANTALFEHVGQNQRREPLPEARDRIHAARRQFSEAPPTPHLVLSLVLEGKAYFPPSRRPWNCPRATFAFHAGASLLAG